MIPFFMGAAGGAAPIASQVFATTLYTGNGSSLTVTSGINLAGQGGLVWGKYRGGVTRHFLVDTVRGATFSLASNTTDSTANNADGVTGFTASGFSLGSDGPIYNGSSNTYVAWSFARAARFFDVVTYSGTGANRTVSHNLGTTPGMIIVKRRDTTGAWPVYHRANRERRRPITFS